MKEWTPRIVILGLLLLIVAVPLVLRPAAATRSNGPTSDAGRLIILTPHNEQIRYEVARGFNAWRVAHNKPAITFDWRSSGGTTDLDKQVRTEFERAAADGKEDQGIGKDLFFGGGDFEQNALAKGTEIKRGGKKMMIPVLMPIELPQEAIQAFPQASLAGVPLYHRDTLWVGVVLSSFGVIYNNDVLGMLGVDAPKTWGDLTNVRYRGWVALSDPTHSGSIAATYDVILRRTGWTEGWSMLRRVFANARYFTASAPKVPVDVSTGDAAAGMCIDFMGRFQVGAIGGGRIGYIDPLNMTAVTPDPISILRGAPHKDLALEFIVWLLSPDAQVIWQRKMKTPGGPDRFELRRLPIRRDLYTPEEMSKWVDHVNPFTITTPLPPDMPDFYSTVGPVTQAMAVDTGEELQAAWAAIIAHPNHPKRDEMLRLFDAMPPELTLVWPDMELERSWRDILADKAHPRHAEAAVVLKKFTTELAARYDNWKNQEKVLEDRLRWTRFFKGNYREIAETLGRE